MPTPGLQVMVKFPKEVPLDIQGSSLLLLEKILRQQTKLDIRVVKELLQDDSKLRRMMTLEQRERL